MKRVLFLALALISASFLTVSSAQAALSVDGAYSFGGGDATNVLLNSGSWKLGAEGTLGVTDLFEVGVFYDHNFLSTQIGSAGVGLNSFGGVLRLGIPILGIFVDGKLGDVMNTLPNSDSTFGWGLGVGYHLPLTAFTELRPRIAYRSLPIGSNNTSASFHTIDIEAMLTFSLF